MTNRNTSLDGLMCEFGWAVHDFQNLANRISLLAASLDSSDDFDASNFYADVDTLTSPHHMSATGKKIAEALTDEDRAVLRRTKKIRDELVYRFFLEFKVDGQRGLAPPEAKEKLAESQDHITQALTVVDMLYKKLTTA